MRGALHLLPLCVCDSGDSGASAAATPVTAAVQQDAVHPIPEAASAAASTSEALPVATSGRLATTLASVQSDLV